MLYHFKEKKPNETIDFLVPIISNILEKNNLKGNLRCTLLSKEYNLFSYNFNIIDEQNNLIAITNGKGITPELALASCFGEFMERYLNNKLIGTLLIKQEDDLLERLKKSVFIKKNTNYKDNKVLTYDELYNQKNNFLKEYMPFLLGSDDFLKEYIFEKDNYNCLPFFSIKDNKIYYIPKYFDLFLKSTGMCAGNTKEEALIEGLCEIIERETQQRILGYHYESITLKTDFLENNFPKVNKILQQLKNNNPNLEMFFKYISIDENLDIPICAFVCIDHYNKTYGINLGCHPSLEIALIRCLTEAMQNKSIKQFSSLNKLEDCKDENKLYSPFNSLYLMCNNSGIYNDFFFINENFSKNEFRSYDYINSKEMLNILLNQILNMFNVKDILIRDVSRLGFYAYQIYIPQLIDFEGNLEKVVNNREQYIDNDIYTGGFFKWQEV